MKTIWKFKAEGAVEMPVGATILTAQIQANEICIWAEVNPEAPTERRRFFIFGTGHPIPNTPNGLHYISTVQDGIYVWHVYVEAK